MRLAKRYIGSAPNKSKTRENRAKHNIHHAANWIIGGYENLMLDYPETAEEYISASKALEDRESLASEIYIAATTEIYEEGFCGWGGDADRILKDLKFLGKEKLMELVNAEITEQLGNI